MDVYGEGREIQRALLLRLAEEHDVPKAKAIAVIEQTCAAATQLMQAADDFPIRKVTRQRLMKLIDANAARVG